MTSKGNGVYEFKTEITPVKVYITYDVANYDLSAFGGITIGNTESTAASITAGMQHIQIDKKSETLTVTWRMTAIPSARTHTSNTERHR